MSGQQGAPRRGAPSPVLSLIWRLIALALIDAVAIAFGYAFFHGGLALAAVVLLVVTAAINVVFLVPGLYPLRWISPGVLLLMLMVVYPVLYTVYIAFTNYNGVDHLLSKQQVIERLERTLFVPEDTSNLSWRAYRSPGGQFLIWLTLPDGTHRLGDPRTGIEQVQPDDPRFGPVDPEDGLPTSIEEYAKVGRLESFRYLTTLSNLVITDEDAQLRIETLDRATLGVPRYEYNPTRDVVYDNQAETDYFPREGYFVDAQGNRATVSGGRVAPGFVDFVGTRQFERALTDPNISSVFFAIFGWTVAFSFLSVALSFAVGLGLALVFNDQRLPLKGIFRTLAIIPYTIPGFISALVWAGLLNPNFGPINNFLRDFVGMNPQWFSDGNLAKMAVLIVNTWLGYPYMMIVSLGALQSIPSDLYEAAEIDGASAWQRFRTITFPLLLIALAPLLIGSFAFNFNNFTLIELLTEGRPAIVGATSPAGQTDILISYSFRVAFAAGRGQDYAFAAALAVFIFAIVAAITIVNFRLSRRLENMI